MTRLLPFESRQYTRVTVKNLQESTGMFIRILKEKSEYSQQVEGELVTSCEDLLDDTLASQALAWPP